VSKILDFYRQETPDTEGRMISDIWQWDHGQLESSHDYIQWLFPLDVESDFNPDAPLLTKEDREAIERNDLLQNNVRRSLELLLNFLGLAFDRSDGGGPADRIVNGSHFETRKRLWMHPNHNWLRITRILKSLRLLGLENEARMLFDCLRDIHREGLVSENSFEFWKRAMEIN
jgi:hypothetical protein